VLKEASCSMLCQMFSTEKLMFTFNILTLLALGVFTQKNMQDTWQFLRVTMFMPVS